MEHKTKFYISLLGAGFIAIISACTGSSNVINPPPLRSEVSGASTTKYNDDNSSSSLGASETVQERTPEQMRQWEINHPQSTQEKAVPFMPTEKDYWEKKKDVDTKSRTAQ